MFEDKKSQYWITISNFFICQHLHLDDKPLKLQNQKAMNVVH